MEKKSTSKKAPLIELTDSQKHDQLLIKMFKIQQECGGIEHDSTNPAFRSKYTTLQGIFKHIKSLLTEYKLFYQTIVSERTIAVILYDVETNTKTTLGQTEIPSSVYDSNSKNQAQAFGSVLTYYTRYLLCCGLGINALLGSDDDGNSADTANLQDAQSFQVVKKDALTDKQQASIVASNTHPVISRGASKCIEAEETHLLFLRIYNDFRFLFVKHYDESQIERLGRLRAIRNWEGLNKEKQIKIFEALISIVSDKAKELNERVAS